MLSLTTKQLPFRSTENVQQGCGVTDTSLQSVDPEDMELVKNYLRKVTSRAAVEMFGLSFRTQGPEKKELWERRQYLICWKL